MGHAAKKYNLNQMEDTNIVIDEMLKKVTLESFVVNSNDFFQLIQSKETLAERVEETHKVIDIGAFVKSKVQMVMDTDYIDNRVKDMTHDFEKAVEIIQKDMLNKVEQNFDPAKADSYSHQINTFFKEKMAEFKQQVSNSVEKLAQQKKSVGDKIDESFNPDLKHSYFNQMIEFVDGFKQDLTNQFDVKQVGSVTHDLNQMLLQQFGPDGNLLKSIEHRLSFDNPESAVVQLQSSINKKLDELKEEIVAGRSASEAEQAVVNKTTLKGYSFEDALYLRLQEYAQKRGDVVEDLSKVYGDVARGRKGDFLYTVTALNKKIAIEAKSATMTSLKKALEVMDGSKINRNADYVLYITETDEQLQKQVDGFQEYENDKLITHSSLIDIALKVAIYRLQLENSEIDGIDRAAVETEINNITNALKSFSTIKAAVTTIKQQAENINNKSSAIKGDIQSALENLNTLLFEEGEI